MPEERKSAEVKAAENEAALQEFEAAANKLMELGWTPPKLLGYVHSLAMDHELNVQRVERGDTEDGRTE